MRRCAAERWARRGRRARRGARVAARWGFPGASPPLPSRQPPQPPRPRCVSRRRLPRPGRAQLCCGAARPRGARGERGMTPPSSLSRPPASPVPRPPSPASSSAGPGRAGAVAWSRSPCGPAGRGARAPGGQARQWCHSFVTSPRVSAPRPARRSSFCYFFFVCLSGLTFLSFVLERKAGVVSSALNFTSCHSPPPEKRFPFETHASNCRRGSKSWSLLKERGFVWFGLVCEMKIFGKLRN